jgi:hypothetical protein
MLPDGTKLRHPIAFPTMKERKVVGVKPLPCCGEGCLDATRNLFDEALRQGSEVVHRGRRGALGDHRRNRDQREEDDREEKKT